MRVLNWYITKSFLVTFGMAIFILTFCMTGARIAIYLDTIVNGIPLDTFCKFIIYVMPVMLTYTIPWSILAAVMLIFGRLSADSEITAMRACGISILQIVAPIMLIVFLITGLSFFMHLELGPVGLWKSRTLMQTVSVESPTALFEPGKLVNPPNTGMLVYVGDKIGQDQLKDIQIFISAANEEVAQDISAPEGFVKVDKEKKILTLVLKNCLTINKADKEITRLISDELHFSIDLGKKANSKELWRDAKYMRLDELLAYLRMIKRSSTRTPVIECKLESEISKRIAFALSPIAFLLIGIPLAIRTGRRETSVGLFLSVILAGVFFLLIIFIQDLHKEPKLYPQYLLWIPNLLFQIVGAILTYRISQR